MSDPRPTARSIAEAFGDENLVAELTAAIEADRAASDAREDRLREALERIGVSQNSREVCGVCHKTFTNCELFNYPECPGLKARRALAAIPPRSDR